MATGLAAVRTKRNPTVATPPRATVPPMQQTAMPHLSLPEWPGIAFMSSGQQSSIDMSVEPPIPMSKCASPDDIGPATADPPSGIRASEAAIASARMLRKIRMRSSYLLRCGAATIPQLQNGRYHNLRPRRYFDPSQVCVTPRSFLLRYRKPFVNSPKPNGLRPCIYTRRGYQTREGPHPKGSAPLELRSSAILTEPRGRSDHFRRC